ncbi:MAG: hypothetical protein K6G48_04840 [Acholeplasmatales bacterium]|nr:hypothetical protein [Acholeplasmatales bacterium]
MKTFLKLLFSPIWFLFEHNTHEKIVEEKTGAVKYILTVVLIAIIIVLVYYVWGELL